MDENIIILELELEAESSKIVECVNPTLYPPEIIETKHWNGQYIVAVSRVNKTTHMQNLIISPKIDYKLETPTAQKYPIIHKLFFINEFPSKDKRYIFI